MIGPAYWALPRLPRATWGKHKKRVTEPASETTHRASHEQMCSHRQKTREPLGRPTTLAGPGSHLDMCTVTGIAIMPKGHNTCIWLRLSSTELCGRSCLGDYCKVHLVQLRKGSHTKPCQGCGVGVVNKLRLCCPCGYRGEWRRATKATQREFARLAAIELPI